MADAVVSAVINKLVDIGANMIMDESSGLCWSQEDVEWLEREMKHMQCYLENAEAKKATNPRVANLIEDIRDLAHHVDDILDTYLPRIKSHRSNGLLKRTTCFMPYCWTSCVFSREIGKIKRKVVGIDEDKKRYDIEDISAIDGVSNVDPRTTKLHVDDPIIVGFDQDIEKLKSKLEEHHFVSIVGMPGLGKTTLAKKVFKGIKHGFDCCASVFVSQTPNIASLMRDIANQVGVGRMDENLEANLYSFLQQKRYVVFLDDIWDTKAWDSLKGCLPIDSENASRIIITSRNTDVGRYIGGENSLHRLHQFDYQTSWELFSRSIDIPSSELEMIGKQIVQKCGGIPLAIMLTVGMLRERGMSEFSWNGVLHSIGENANDECSQILSLSYRELPNFLKPCYLYFGNFQEDYKFSASQVIRLWMAEKFIPRVHVASPWEPEDVGADYISRLEARNLIQVVTRGHDGRVKKFRIHDLLHNLCVNIGRELDFLNTIDHLEVSSAKRVRRLTAHHHTITEIDKLIYQMTKLRALLHVTFDEEIEIELLKSIFGRFKLLQVLILEVDNISKSTYIPSEIGSLSQLKFLKIQSRQLTEFELRSLISLAYRVVIPRSIRNLKNLQTLDFQGCHGTLKLPIEIWKMEQLRHLLLVNHVDSDFKDAVKFLLPNLQTLVGTRFYDLKPNWLLKLTSLRKLELLEVKPKIMEVLCGPEPISKKLESLRCESYNCTMTTRVSLVKYSRLVKLELYCVELPMQQPLELPPSLIKLTLVRTLLTEDPMKILKNLPKLKFLHLKIDSYIGSKMDCSGADSFPQLEILRLYNLKELEELIEEEMGMPKIRQVNIQLCNRLVRIPQRLQQFSMRN